MFAKMKLKFANNYLYTHLLKDLPIIHHNNSPFLKKLGKCEVYGELSIIFGERLSI